MKELLSRAYDYLEFEEMGFLYGMGLFFMTMLLVLLVLIPLSPILIPLWLILRHYKGVKW